jgi:hypothetical protein
MPAAPRPAREPTRTPARRAARPTVAALLKALGGVRGVAAVGAAVRDGLAAGVGGAGRVGQVTEFVTHRQRALARYAELVNRYGVDSEAAENFRLRWANRDAEVGELMDLARTLKKGFLARAGREE